VALAQLLETRKRIFDAATAGRSRNGEQRVGDAAHRRHHDRWTAAIAQPGRANDLNQSSNCVWVSDGGTAEFLDNHEQQILYGKAGVDRVRRRGLALVLVVVRPDGAIVTPRIRDDFAMASIELVHLVAFSIEGGNRLLVFVPVIVLVRKWPFSFSHLSAHLDPGLSVKSARETPVSVISTSLSCQSLDTRGGAQVLLSTGI